MITSSEERKQNLLREWVSEKKTQKCVSELAFIFITEIILLCPQSWQDVENNETR